jgi:hypothetical protein
MADLAHGVSGKWSEEKQLELQKAWLKAIGLKHPELGPMAADLQIDTDEKTEVHMMFACMCVCVCVRATNRALLTPKPNHFKPNKISCIHMV